MSDLEKQLDEAMNVFKEEVASIRGSRPTPALVEDIMVDYFGQNVPVKQLGSISVIPPREIQVQVWDLNSAAAAENAIAQKLNIQTARDGAVIHCNLPDLTQERRVELEKIIRQKTEEARIRSRVARDKIKKDIDQREQEGELTEDDQRDMMDSVQEKMDAFNNALEEIVKRKLAEIGL